MPTLHTLSLFCLLYPQLFPVATNGAVLPPLEQRKGYCFKTTRPTLGLLGARLSQRALGRPPSGEIWLGVQSLHGLSPLLLHSARHLAQLGYRVTLLGDYRGPLPSLAPLKLIALDPSAPLRDEWFVLIDSGGFRVALCAVALVDFGEQPEPDTAYIALRTQVPLVVTNLTAALRSAELARPALRACG